ncbi:MAG: deaminase [Thermoleophilaceae bacterium]
MGKLVVTEFVSVDGVFEDPGGSEDYEHGGWTFEYDRGEDGDKFKLDEVMEAEVQLLGRATYRPVEAEGCRDEDRRLGRRPGADLPAGRMRRRGGWISPARRRR